MPSKRKAGEHGDSKHEKKRKEAQEEERFDDPQPYIVYPIQGDAAKAARDGVRYVEHTRLLNGFEWDFVVESHPKSTPWSRLRKYKHVKCKLISSSYEFALLTKRLQYSS